MRKKKTLLLAVGICIAVLGAITGILFLIKNSSAKAVNVYSVSDFSTDYYWGSSSETYGSVFLDKLQTVYLSDTQTVSEVYVQAGQEVKAGDPLLAYNTTLTDLALQKADIALQKLKAQQTKAQNDLQALNAMKPHSSVLVTPEVTTPVLNPLETPRRISGSGTADDPYYYLWGGNDTFNPQFLATLFPAATDPEDPAQPDPVLPDGECYAVFMVRESNALEGEILQSWGMHLVRSGGEVTWTMFPAQIPDHLQPPEQENQEPYYVESGSEYTAAELVKMRADKRKEISDLDLQIKIAEVDYRQKQQEMTNGQVVATVDGVVKTVNTPEDAKTNGEPVVTVSGGGGYYVKGTVSELEMENLQPGQTVSVVSMESNNTYEASVVSISNYPVTNNNGWSNGNPNVSYYPLVVFIDESATLRESEYVSIQYTATSGGGEGLYLENQFLRMENGKTYVYVQSEDGTLEKRYLTTGMAMDSSYTQILSGLSREDYIAFPYGSNLKEGAATQESTPDAFYNP